MDTSVRSVVFLNFAIPKGKKLHNFLFQSSSLIYWYKKIPSLKTPSGEIYKKRKCLENP